MQNVDRPEPEDDARAEIPKSGDESQVCRAEIAGSLVLTRRSSATGGICDGREASVSWMGDRGWE